MTMRPTLAALLMSQILSLAPASAGVKNPDTYTYAMIGDADSLDPAWSYDTASHMVILNIYEPLLAYDKDSTEDLVPIVAEKVPSRANGLISADGLTYTFPIRKTIKFHDGTPLTPEDVRYSLMRFMLYDRDAGPSWMLLEPLLGRHSTREDGKLLADSYDLAAKAVTVEGDSVVLRLPKPYAPLLTILASWGPSLSKSWMTAHGDWDGSRETWARFNNPKKEASPLYQAAMGSGPWTLERWDRKTMEFVLARHGGYWRKPAALARVFIKGIKEFGTRKLMLEAGDADAIYADRIHYSQIKDLPGVSIIDDLPTVEMTPVVFFTFQVNTTANPNIGSGKLDGRGIPADLFSDKDMRKGFAYSLDYQGFIRDVFLGKGTQATGHIPKSLPGHNPRQKAYTLDLAKAAEHFRKARGGKVWDKGFQFTLTYNSGNDIRRNLCQMIKKNVESLNRKFKLDVRPVEWPTFLDNYRTSKLPMFAMGWNADFPDPHNFAFPFMHSKGDYPLIQKYSNPEADKLIEEAISETDLAKRKKLYHQVLAIAHEDAPHLVIIDTVRFRTHRNWVRGWYHNPIFPDSPYGSYFYPISKSDSPHPGTLIDSPL